jgi:hypothetical protein
MKFGFAAAICLLFSQEACGRHAVPPSTGRRSGKRLRSIGYLLSRTVLLTKSGPM